MLLLPKHRWFRQVATLRGSALGRIWPRLAVVTTVAVLVTVMHDLYGWFPTSLTPLPFSLIAVALGIFLGFRNNTSYDRFWEGRKLWGALINTTRSTTRQVLTLVRTDDPEQQAQVDAFRDAMVRRVIAYVHVFRQHLRDQDDLASVAEFLDADECAALVDEINRPVAILQNLGNQIELALSRGWVHPMHVPTLEASLVALTDIQGGCERIKSTPIPGSYTILMHRIVAVYTLTLPFGIVDTVGFYTPLVALLIGYAFFGLDAVGDEIEDPFGTDVNDLPLSALSRLIEVNLRQRLGDNPLPPLATPTNGILN